VRLVLPNPDLLLPAGIPCKVLFEMNPVKAMPVLVDGGSQSN
jgi:hypothetical protein